MTIETIWSFPGKVTKKKTGYSSFQLEQTIIHGCQRATVLSLAWQHRLYNLSYVIMLCLVARIAGHLRLGQTCQAVALNLDINLYIEKFRVRRHPYPRQHKRVSLCILSLSMAKIVITCYYAFPITLSLKSNRVRFPNPNLNKRIKQKPFTQVQWRLKQ